MEYIVEISPRAWKDLRKLDGHLAKRIISKIGGLKSGLTGDVKRLTDFETGYRLRVGDYRVLFDLESDKLIVRRIKNRREAY